MKEMVLDIPRFVMEDIPEGIVTLNADQSHHLYRVLRLKAGDPVLLIDGRGTLAKGEVSQPHGKHSQVLVRGIETHEDPARVGIAFALPKPQALDFVIRRCAEVGVAALQPLVTDHSAPAKHWNADRWHRIVEEVSKQCQRLHFPELGEPISLDEFLAGHPKAEIFVCDENTRRSRPTVKGEGRAWAVVGPEGGWSASERKRFTDSGAGLLGLGQWRLRTETACLVAATLLRESTGEI